VTKRGTSISALPGKRATRELPIIGWSEWLSIPSLSIERIKAKVDSGARTSAIHAYDIKTFSDGGAPHVSFVVHPRQRSRQNMVQCIAPLLDERSVRSSSGHEGRRYVIEVEVCLGGHTWPIELTLADRDAMGFRMLLGRQAVSGRFLIDPGRTSVIGRSVADIRNTVINRVKKL
jgi:hypothetical protein